VPYCSRRLLSPLAHSILWTVGEIRYQRRKDLWLYECDGPIEDTTLCIDDKLILVLTESYIGLPLDPASLSRNSSATQSTSEDLDSA